MNTEILSVAWTAFTYGWFAFTIYLGYWIVKLPFWSARTGGRVVYLPTYLFIGWMAVETRFQEHRVDVFAQNFAEGLVAISGGGRIGVAAVALGVTGYVGLCVGARAARHLVPHIPGGWKRRVPI